MCSQSHTLTRTQPHKQGPAQNGVCRRAGSDTHISHKERNQIDKQPAGFKPLYIQYTSCINIQEDFHTELNTSYPVARLCILCTHTYTYRSHTSGLDGCTHTHTHTHTHTGTRLTSVPCVLRCTTNGENSVGRSVKKMFTCDDDMAKTWTSG